MVPFVMESAVGVHHRLVPVGDLVVVDVQRVLEAAQHLVRGVRIFDEEGVGASGNFGGVVVEHGRDTHVEPGERESPRGERLEDIRYGFIFWPYLRKIRWFNRSNRTRIKRARIYGF